MNKPRTPSPSKEYRDNYDRIFNCAGREAGLTLDECADAIKRMTKDQKEVRNHKPGL